MRIGEGIGVELEQSRSTAQMSTQRKLVYNIITTNVAETSLTIPSIYYVIDPGFLKQNAYDPGWGMDSLVVMPISQAQA